MQSARLVAAVAELGSFCVMRLTSAIGIALIQLALVGCEPSIHKGWNKYPTGMREEFTGYFEDGQEVMHGELRRYRPDGTLLERQHFSHGVSVGTWESYYPSGKVEHRMVWRDGKLVSEQYFDEDGKEIETQNKITGASCLRQIRRGGNHGQR